MSRQDFRGNAFISYYAVWPNIIRYDIPKDVVFLKTGVLKIDFQRQDFIIQFIVLILMICSSPIKKFNLNDFSKIKVCKLESANEKNASKLGNAREKDISKIYFYYKW